MKTLYTLILSFIVLSAYSQPDLVWNKTYGGSSYERGYYVDQTSDSGLVVAGYSWSNNGDVEGHHGSVSEPDGWILKLNANGDTVWTRSLGGIRAEYANMIKETPDQGYIVAAQSKSSDGDVWGHHGPQWYYDVWLVKLDANGDTVWTRSYGGTEDDFAYAVDVHANGDLMVGASARSTDDDVWDNNGSFDMWIIKTDAMGDSIWTRSFGGTSNDFCEGIRATPDGGCIAVGWTQSNNGDVTGSHGSRDMWVIKVDSLGNLEWEKALGGSGNDYGFGVDLTNDGNYIVAGKADSQDGDVWDNFNWFDYWVVKLNTLGDTLWTHSYGGSREDELTKIRSTCDGGYILVGSSGSDDGAVNGHHGAIDSLDAWVVKIDENGTIEWDMSYGGSRHDNFYGVMPTDDGYYALAGYSYSSDGDVSGTNGIDDVWVAKMRINGNTPEICVVTVDSATRKNVVVWEDAAFPAQSYNVYKETFIANQYVLVANVPFDSLSIYIDLASNPDAVSNRYRISSIDSCGFESDRSIVHKTMHAQANLGVNNDVVNLIWEDYEGLSFGTYIIYKGSSTLTMDSIDAVPSTIFTYTDSIQYDTLDLFYVISLVHPAGGCFADKGKSYNSSKSNTSSVNGKTPITLVIVGIEATVGNCDGFATVTAAGGIAPFVYLWNDSLAQNTATATNLCPGNYTVIVVDDVGDTVTTTIAIGQVSTGIANLQLNTDISIFPNPNTGKCHLAIASVENPISLHIFNVLGQEVTTYESIQNSIEINLSDQPNGVYYFKFVSSDGIAIKKVVIE